jgi:hypothetical protein
LLKVSDLPSQAFVSDSDDFVLNYTSEGAFHAAPPPPWMRISPGKGSIHTWSLAEQLVSVNEFGTDWRLSNSARSYRPTKAGSPGYHQFTFAICGDRKAKVVRVNVPLKFAAFQVEARLEWLQREWRPEDFAVERPLGPLLMRRFSLEKSVDRSTSKCIIRGDAVPSCAIQDASHALRPILCRITTDGSVSLYAGNTPYKLRHCVQLCHAVMHYT